jgi:predicted alpha/beta hydrolase
MTEPQDAIDLPTAFSAGDGLTLRGRWHHPAEGGAATVVVVAPGAGIPARYYQRFAHDLAGRGYTVLTFDYRGIGESRTRDLRTLDAGMEDWATLDLGGALAFARASHPHARLALVTHSVAALFVCAARDSTRVSRMVFLGPHTGYWRDYRRAWRYPMFVTWHALMPFAVKRFGYFPGRALRLGEDMPARAALDWAARRTPAIVGNDEQARRFGPGLAHAGEIRAPTLAITASDDAFAPPAAAARLLANYPALPVTRETVTPRSLGVRRLGHFGFLRRPTFAYFARRTADWLG